MHAHMHARAHAHVHTYTRMYTHEGVTALRRHKTHKRMNQNNNARYTAVTALSSSAKALQFRADPAAVRHVLYGQSWNFPRVGGLVLHWRRPATLSAASLRHRSGSG